MKMTDEIFQSFNFKKDRSMCGEYRWYYQGEKLYGDEVLNYSVEKDIELETVIRNLKDRWIEIAEKNLKYSFRNLLGLNK